VNELGAAAAALARRGWFVFPVAPRGKTPIIKRGMLDASIDEGLVAAWWEDRGEANIGVNCGKSGLLVVDLDGEDAVRAWADLAARHGGHPRTLVARTGKGFHGYFTGEGPSSAGRIGPKIDTRGRGGYVIAPPSVHGSGAVYEWIEATLDPVPVPEWLTEALDRGLPDSSAGERRRLPDGAPSRPTDAPRSRRSPRRWRRPSRASAIRCGRLSAAGQLAEQVAHRELVAAAVDAGLDGDEAEATFRSGFTAGLFRPVILEALGKSSA
jgi:hypothetical protein